MMTPDGVEGGIESDGVAVGPTGSEDEVGMQDTHPEGKPSEQQGMTDEEAIEAGLIQQGEAADHHGLV